MKHMKDKTLMTRSRLRLPALFLSLALLAGCDSAEEKAETYYSRAMATLAAGDLDKAALDFRNALKIREDYTEALLGLASLEEKRRNFDVAASIYLSIAQRDAKDFDSRVKISQLLLASEQADAAATYAEQAYVLAPKDPRVLVVKAGIALSRGKQDEAVRFANEALAGEPSNVTALMVLVSERIAAQDRQGALAIIERGLARNEADTGLQLLKLRTLQAMGDESLVEQQFRRLAELLPGNHDIQSALVTWYLAKGHKPEAERTMHSFARANPADETAQIKLAMLISRTRGAAAAATELKDIIASFPDQDEAKRVALRTAEAQLDYAAGRPDAAVKSLEELIAATNDPRNRTRAQLQLAQLLAAMKQWTKATELSEAVLAADARNVEALMVRASARMAAGNNAGAVEDLNIALGAAPGSADVTLLLGEAYERTGSASLAEEQYAKALALSGYSAASGTRLAQFLMRYGRAGRAMQVLDDLRLRGTADRAVLSLLAQLKLDARDWRAAGQIADELRASVPGGGDGAADQIIAAALSGMNRQEEGIGLLLSRLRQTQDQQEIESALVRAFMRAGRHADAEALLRDRLAQEPANGRLNLLLGSVLMSAGRKQAAEDAFRTAVANGQGEAVLAQFYLRERRPEEAAVAARSGLARDPGSAPLRLLLAESLEALGNIDGAIAEYERMLQADPTSTVAANNLASLLSGRQDDPKALQRAFDIAVRFHNSDVPQFLDTLGWIHYLRGDREAALPLLKRAAEKLPKSGAVQFHLGMALKDAGQPELSAAVLQKAISLAPSPDSAYVRTATAALAQINTSKTAN